MNASTLDHAELRAALEAAFATGVGIGCALTIVGVTLAFLLARRHQESRGGL